MVVISFPRACPSNLVCLLGAAGVRASPATRHTLGRGASTWRSTSACAAAHAEPHTSYTCSSSARRLPTLASSVPRTHTGHTCAPPSLAEPHGWRRRGRRGQQRLRVADGPDRLPDHVAHPHRDLRPEPALRLYGRAAGRRMRFARCAQVLALRTLWSAP